MDGDYEKVGEADEAGEVGDGEVVNERTGRFLMQGQMHVDQHDARFDQFQRSQDEIKQEENIIRTPGHFSTGLPSQLFYPQDASTSTMNTNHTLSEIQRFLTASQQRDSNGAAPQPQLTTGSSSTHGSTIQNPTGGGSDFLMLQQQLLWLQMQQYQRQFQQPNANSTFVSQLLSDPSQVSIGEASAGTFLERGRLSTAPVSQPVQARVPGAEVLHIPLNHQPSAVDFQRMLTSALQGSGGLPNDPLLVQAVALGLGQVLFGGSGNNPSTSAANNILSLVQQQQHQQSQQQQNATNMPINPLLIAAASASLVAASSTSTLAATSTSAPLVAQAPTTSTPTTVAQPHASQRRKRPYHHESFPAKLHRLLAETEAQGKDDIVSFNAEGTCFCIHQPDLFEEEIIPHYFRHKKISSFKRQLSMYGFVRILDGPDVGGFAHPLFRKRQPELSKQMDRVN